MSVAAAACVLLFLWIFGGFLFRIHLQFEETAEASQAGSSSNPSDSTDPSTDPSEQSSGSPSSEPTQTSAAQLLESSFDMATRADSVHVTGTIHIDAKVQINFFDLTLTADGKASGIINAAYPQQVAGHNIVRDGNDCYIFGLPSSLSGYSETCDLPTDTNEFVDLREITDFQSFLDLLDPRAIGNVRYDSADRGLGDPSRNELGDQLTRVRSSSVRVWIPEDSTESFPYKLEGNIGGREIDLTFRDWGAAVAVDVPTEATNN